MSGSPITNLPALPKYVVSEHLAAAPEGTALLPAQDPINHPGLW